MVKGSKELPMGWNISLKAATRKMVVGGSIWLREPGENWGGNGGESGDKGKSNLNINFANIMQNVNKNLGINLVGRSNLPKMDEEVPDALDIDSLNEDRPMLAMDGKKRPHLHKDGSGSSAMGQALF